MSTLLWPDRQDFTKTDWDLTNQADRIDKACHWFTYFRASVAIKHCTEDGLSMNEILAGQFMLQQNRADDKLRTSRFGRKEYGWPPSADETFAPCVECGAENYRECGCLERVLAGSERKKAA